MPIDPVPLLLLHPAGAARADHRFVLDVENMSLFTIAPCPRNGAVVTPIPWLAEGHPLRQLPVDSLYSSAQAAAIWFSSQDGWDTKGCAYDWGPPLLLQSATPSLRRWLIGLGENGFGCVLRTETPRFLLTEVGAKQSRLTACEPEPLEKTALDPFIGVALTMWARWRNRLGRD
jgi:hypothetical protein